MLIVTALVKAPAASTQQQLQIAIQLGAIQMGYISTSTPYTPYVAGTNSSNDQKALEQGLLALSETQTKTAAHVIGATALPNSCASTQFQNQLYVATLDALTGVNSNALIASGPVTTSSGSVTVPKTTLSTALTTATAVVQLANTLVPNRGVSFAQSAVTATEAVYTNSGFLIPVWGPAPKTTGSPTTVNNKTAATQINNAATAASSCLASACAAYAKGTINWQAFPATNYSATNLPNFGAKPITASGQTQMNDPQGLSEAAAAVSAGAIAGLGTVGSNTNYGWTATNVVVMVKSLTTAANKLYAASTNNSNLGNGYTGGTLQSTAFAETAQLAGTNNFSFGSYTFANNTNTIGALDGIISGSIAALGKTQNNLSWVAKGIAEGFLVDYVETSGLGSNSFAVSPTATNGLATFETQNLNYIVNTFTHYGVSASSSLDTAIKNAITAGFTSAYTDWAQGNMASINPTFVSTGLNGTAPLPGAVGIGINGLAVNGQSPKQTTPFLNGVGSPVTDTIGL